jgi:hypothetical protein
LEALDARPVQPAVVNPNTARRVEEVRRLAPSGQEAPAKGRFALVALSAIIASVGAVTFMTIQAKETTTVSVNPAHPVSAGALPATSTPEPAPEPPGFPRNCSTTMLFDNRDIQLDPSKLPLTATRGCDLTLRGVQLEAPSTLINVRSGAVVRLENATLMVTNGPAVNVSDDGSVLTLSAATLRANEGAALEIERDAKATLTDALIVAPVAIRATRKAQVVVEGGDLQGEIVEDGGFVFGLDPAGDDTRRRKLRADAYAAGACHGVANCLSQNGYRGRVELDVFARIKDGQVDAVRVVPLQGTSVPKPAATCIEDAMRERPVANWADDGVGYRTCSMGGDIHGGTQMIRQSSGFFFEADSAENAAQMKRLFR